MANRRELIAADISAVIMRQMDEFNAQTHDIVMAQVKVLAESLKALKPKVPNIVELVCRDLQRWS